MIRNRRSRVNPFEEGVFVDYDDFNNPVYLVYIGDFIFHYDNEKDALETYEMWRNR